jgi:ParB-like nuclease domain
MSISVLAAGTVMVPLARIPTDEGAQTRVKVRTAVVRDYAAAMIGQLAEGGLRFPPVILFTDGQNYWLGDGFHRILAAGKAGLTEIAAEVRPGTQRDALLFGICANSAHGLPRTQADKRKAAALLLADAEWSQ